MNRIAGPQTSLHKDPNESMVNLKAQYIVEVPCRTVEKSDPPNANLLDVHFTHVALLNAWILVLPIGDQVRASPVQLTGQRGLSSCLGGLSNKGGKEIMALIKALKRPIDKDSRAQLLGLLVDYERALRRSLPCYVLHRTSRGVLAQLDKKIKEIERDPPVSLDLKNSRDINAPRFVITKVSRLSGNPDSGSANPHHKARQQTPYPLPPKNGKSNTGSQQVFSHTHEDIAQCNGVLAELKLRMKVCGSAKRALDQILEDRQASQI